MAQRSRAGRTRPGPGPGGEITARIFAVCDYAALTLDSKLYISGANIGGMLFREMPGPIGQAFIAVLLAVPWTLTSETHLMRIRLLNSDRQPIGPDPLVEAQAEVGRPPGTRPGQEFGLPFAFALTGIQIPQAMTGYFHLEVNGNTLAIHQFQFGLAPPGMLPSPTPGA